MVTNSSTSSLKFDYKLIRRDIKHPRIEFKTGKLELIVPRNCKDPDDIIEKHKDWIGSKKMMIDRALSRSTTKTINTRQITDFRNLVKENLEIFSSELGVEYNNIIYRTMKTKWGSCSSKRNITVNQLMTYLPDKLIEYVLFHELSHLVERKHNERFWELISTRFPNYQESEKDLLVYWFAIQEMMRGEINVERNE